MNEIHVKGGVLLNKKNAIALVYGWISCLILFAIASTLVALCIKFTNITAFTLGFLTLIIGFLSLFTSGIIAGLKAKENGWLIGCLVGLGFFSLTFLIQYLGMNQGISVQQMMYQAAYVFAAVFGSIIGVNISKAS